MPIRVAALLFALIGGVLMLATTAAAETYRGYEMPPFETELQEGPFEIRRYRPHTLAEVQVAGDRQRAVRQGFRALFGYITGGNSTGEKISMTVPVTQEQAGAAWAVRFMMPGRYNAVDLPSAEAVRVVEVAGGRRAVIRFTGFAGEQALATQEARLRSWATSKGLTLGGPRRLAFYDAPFTLPWRRRIEISFALD